MLKICSGNKLNIRRQLRKNTVAANYRKSKNFANMFAITAAVEIARFPSWGIHDVGITSMLGTLALKGISDTFKWSKALKPIKQRARAIKQISKNNLKINA